MKRTTPIFGSHSKMKAFMKNETKRQEKRKAKELLQEENNQSDIKNEIVSLEPYVPKATSLLFYRQYNTYQSLLEIKSKNGNEIWGKVILYIMRWFKKRLDRDNVKNLEELQFLDVDYPEPEEYEGFDVSKVSDINTLSFVDVITAYVESRSGWLFRIIELDNNNDNMNVQGRSFTTQICVYRKEKSVVLGICISCREPWNNTEDPAVYRPGFVRDMFFDDDLYISEEGFDLEYAFGKSPYILNGKAFADCERLYASVVNNINRQMPILFVPGEFYEKNKEAVDKKTVSLLAYCHIVVWENGARKFFEQCMGNTELFKIAEAGKIVLYRGKKGLDNQYDYTVYDVEEEGILDEIKIRAQKEPLRKQYDYKEYSFKAPWTEKGYKSDDDVDLKIIKEMEAELGHCQTYIYNLENDNDSLQRKIDALEDDRTKLNKQLAKLNADNERSDISLNEKELEIRQLRENENDLAKQLKMLESKIIAVERTEQEKYLPLINLPSADIKDRAEICEWIDTYYSDLLLLHPAARQSMIKCKRNINVRTLCMMLHYLAGYTIHRNNGGNAIDSQAARDYDPDKAAYMVEPCSSGAGGSANIYEDEYIIDISAFNSGEKNVVMDLHIVQGKGRDSDMIRIYFYYDKTIKKSIIGYMPDHLKTRSDPH